MFWSRRNRTLYLRRSALISANSAAARDASPRFTPCSCAPIAQVSGSTVIDPTRCEAAGAIFDMFPPNGLRLSENEDRRTGGLARFQLAVRVDTVFQREELVDLD